MTGWSRSRSFVVALPAVVLALGLSGCLSGGITYGTGVRPGKQTLDDITGIVNFSPKKGPEIEYKPRAPLVVPPKVAALPPPVADTTVAAGDWPVDRDEEQAAIQRAVNSGAIERMDRSEQKKLAKLLPAKLGEDESSSFDREKSKQRKKLVADMKAGVSRDADGNVVRGTLTEPPVAYREPDPTAPTELDERTKKRKFRWPWQR